jgi:hypothetical protein
MKRLFLQCDGSNHVPSWPYEIKKQMKRLFLQCEGSNHVPSWPHEIHK